MDKNIKITANLTEDAVKRGERRIQYVIITFADGGTASFSGPAVVDIEDQEKRRIAGVYFTKPRELPSDMNFESMTESDQSKLVGDDNG